jgi:PA14 domain
MRYLLLFVAFLFTTACACEYSSTVTGQVPPPVPVTLESQVQEALALENEYRLGLGETMLSPGLSCNLYTVTGGNRIQASIPGHNTLTGLSSVGSFLLTSEFNQPNAPVSDGLNVLPVGLRSVYKNMFLLRCQGHMVVLQTGYQVFELSSDDASVLYVNGSKTIDLDNAHGVLTALSTKYMRKGVYPFRLDFAQTGAGMQALILKLNGAVMNPVLYAH